MFLFYLHAKSRANYLLFTFTFDINKICSFFLLKCYASKIIMFYFLFFYFLNIENVILHVIALQYMNHTGISIQST